MICENCLYNKNCQFLLKHRNGEAEGCTAFEDKSEWVHLPCKLGDKIFMIVGDIKAGTAFVDEGKVISVTYEHTGVWIYARYECGLSYHHKFGRGDCFFTVAEAEKTLDKQRKTVNGGKIND